MEKKFKSILKAYQKEISHIRHHSKAATDAITKEAISKTHEALKNNYTYKFHKEPTKERMEIINLIQHYVSEAILPPILKKVEDQIVVLNKEHELIMKMIETILETLSNEKKK
jgi:vacuolar-type H+-ATPase subunit E/Vma4